MEREPSFEREPISSRSSERTELLSSERAIIEYLGFPENERELLGYLEYLRELTRFVRVHVPEQEQERALRELHVAIERPQLGRGIAVPTSPPASRIFRVGNHMDVTVGYSAATQWPDADRSTLELNDGAIVIPDSPVGIIDYYRNIARLGRDRNLIGFTRALVTDITTSLTTLATEVQRLRVTSENLIAFSGMSHLARLAHRFGFTVFDIADRTMQERATTTSFRIAYRIASDNPDWQRLQEKYKPAQIAMISRERLVSDYS